jgi:methylated-DNA-[protein]-cysteine S-methyltransferase
MTMYESTIDTPVGPLTTVVDADGAVLAAGWNSELADVVARIHPSLRGELVRRREIGAATAAVRAYLAGDLDAPAVVPVRQSSRGDFLTAAWKTLREVPAGRPVTYAEFAARAGRPAAVRAAAQACARNAAALFVPCHRVIRTDGSLGGFRWGLDVKRWLLAHEAENLEANGHRERLPS